MTNVSPDTNSEASQPSKDKWVGESQDKWETTSVTKTWFRLRASESAVHINQLPTKNREKLAVDEQRVQKTRARLSRDATKKDYLPELQIAFREWQKEAYENSESKIRHSLENRGNHLKESVCKDFDAEKAIMGDDDPSREFKAGVMFFEQCDHGWKGVTYDKGALPVTTDKFPHQKIQVYEALNSKKYNPFTPTFDDKGNRHLKYIHLPANHMGVSLIPILTSIL